MQDKNAFGRRAGIAFLAYLAVMFCLVVISTMDKNWFSDDKEPVSAIEETLSEEETTEDTSTSNTVVSPKDKGYQDGYISDFCKDRSTSFLFDLAEMVEDVEAPNGFRIDNFEEEQKVYEINEETRYFIQPYEAEQYGAIKTKDHPLEFFYGEMDEITKNDFIKYTKNSDNGFFHIKEENGIVSYIYEIYVP